MKDCGVVMNANAGIRAKGDSSGLIVKVFDILVS